MNSPRRGEPTLFGQPSGSKSPVQPVQSAPQGTAAAAAKDEVKDYNFFVKKGKDLQTKVDAAFAALSSGHAVTDVADSSPVLNANYTVLASTNPTLPASIKGVIESLGFQSTKNWHYRSTRSNAKATEETAYHNYYVFDAAQRIGAIAASWNYSARDKNTDKERVTLCEVFFHQYSEVSQNQPSTLRYVIRDSIQGADSLGIIQEVLKGDVVAKNQGKLFAAGTTQFHALLGSDNGKSVAFMLIDHMNAFRKRIVSAWAKGNMMYFVLGG